MDDEIRDELDPHDADLADLEAVDGVVKPPKDLIDEDVESLDDLADDELEDDEESFDDVDEM
jgi:hypothetical protein